MAGLKPHRRGLYVCAVACVVCVVVLAIAHFAKPSSSNEKNAGTSSGPIATYKAGEAFDLVGEKRDLDEEGNEVWNPWDFAKSWDWTGTMTITAGELVVYDSPESAGFSLSAEEKSLYDGTRVAVVELTVQNVDAVCRESTISEMGAASFNLTMFSLEASSGTVTVPQFFSAPVVEGLSWDDSKSVSYTWAEPGETITARIGYPIYVDGDGTSSTRANTVSDGDRVSLDGDFRVVIQNGWYDGAPIIELGRASVAEAAYAQE